MRALVIDDEPLARSRLKRLLFEQKNCTWVGEACNSVEALQQIDRLKPDLIFLDIEMPEGSGLEFAKTLNQRTLPPAIVFVTAHPEHALEAYRAGPADYLVKPVDPSRLSEALSRLGTHTQAHLEKQDMLNPWVSYQVGNSVRRIRFDQVLYFMAEDKYVKMAFEEGECLLETSLKQLEQQYSNLLVRVHRKSLVNINRLDQLQTLSGTHYVFLKGSKHPLEVSRRLLPNIKAILKSSTAT